MPDGGCLEVLRGPATPLAVPFPFAPVAGCFPGLDPTLVMTPAPGVPSMATRHGVGAGQDLPVPTGKPSLNDAPFRAFAGLREA